MLFISFLVGACTAPSCATGFTFNVDGLCVEDTGAVAAPVDTDTGSPADTDTGTPKDSDDDSGGDSE